MMGSWRPLLVFAFCQRTDGPRFEGTWLGLKKGTILCYSFLVLLLFSTYLKLVVHCKIEGFFSVSRPCLFFIVCLLID